MTRVFTPVTALIAALLLTSQGTDAFIQLPVLDVVSTGIGKIGDPLRNFGLGGIADTLGNIVHEGEGFARQIIHEGASLVGKVTGELAGGFLDLVGLNDTCVGEAAEGCRQVVGDLVHDFLDVSDVNLTPTGVWEALRKRLLLQPGPKWCGVGKAARDNYDRRLLAATDACCRRHSSCPDYIDAGEDRHGLHNDATSTRYHCQCDEEFYHCLKQDNTLVSNKVGIIYFDILRPKCFERNFPAVYCNKGTRTPIPHCAEYVLDRSQRPRWQWLDNPLY